MDSPILLEETQFDVIIYGTGLTETYLSAALAIAGKKVLHLEENIWYGSTFSTHSYQAFLQEINNTQKTSSESVTPDSLPSNASFLKLTKHPQTITNGSHSYYDPAMIETTAESAEPAETEKPAEEANNAPNEQPEKKSLHELFLKEHRQYNFDISTNVLWSRGSVVSNMVISGTNRYLEFHCVKRALYYDQDKIITAPVTKKDIFKSKDVSFVEKRKIMSFVQSVMTEIQESMKEPDKEDGNTSEDNIVQSQEEQETLFVDYMTQQGLTERLQSFMLYIVCLCPSSTYANDMSKKEGMLRVRKYQESSGVYGGTPFLYPLYGISEINQGYSRLGAVNNAIFILNRAVDSIVVDEQSGAVRGVMCDAGQFLEAPVVVTAPRYFPNATARPLCSRFIAVTDKSIHEDSLFHMIVPTSPEREKTIFISQLDFSTCVCPRDRFMVHMICEPNRSPKEDLGDMANVLLRTSKDSDEDKPNALLQAYFTILTHELDDPTPQGVYLCPEYSRADVGLDKYLQKAEELFHQIVGDDHVFFPRRPEPQQFASQEEDTEIPSL